jgi:CubicO group peptidase (beta-lactamase class C family)
MPSAALINTLHTRLDQFITDSEVDGAGLVVYHKGKTIIEWYGGKAAPGLMASPSVLWPLASITKLYTATMIMRLIELGMLTMTTTVHSVLPRFFGDGRENVTLRHLLTHTSGLIYESVEMEQRLMDQTPIVDLIAEAYSAPLLFAPGQEFSYADYNYLLAAEVAVHTTRRPFPDLVRDLVLRPMGLRHTFLPPAPADYVRIAKVRGALAADSDGAMYNSPYALELAHPAFGVVATANDLLRFGLHFVPGGPRILSEASVRTMITDQTGGRAKGWHVAGDPGEGEKPPQAWGIGFYMNTPNSGAVFGDLAPLGCYGHGGASGCHLLINPVDDVVTAYVSNTHVHTNPSSWLRRLHIVLNTVLAAVTSN